MIYTSLDRDLDRALARDLDQDLDRALVLDHRPKTSFRSKYLTRYSHGNIAPDIPANLILPQLKKYVHISRMQHFARPQKNQFRRCCPRDTCLEECTHAIGLGGRT